MSFPTGGVFAVGVLVLVMALLGVATSASATLSWIAFLILVHTMQALAVNSVGLCCISVFVSKIQTLPVLSFSLASLG